MPMTFLGLGCVLQGREPSQVAEHHGNLAPMALQQFLAAGGDEEFGQVGREEAFSAPHALSSRQLVGDALLECVVPLGQLRRLHLQACGLFPGPYRAGIDAQHRLDPGHQEA